MSYVLSMVHPPENGAAFGKATVFEPTPSKELAAFAAARLLGDIVELDLVPLAVFSHQLKVKNTGTDVLHEESGVTFRIDPADTPPNQCSCCGRLVKPGDHAFAGSDDAYCLGCYTWGDDTKISCDPNHTAHANPWTQDTSGARRSIEIVFEQEEDQTDYDIRYSTDPEAGDMWHENDNALIAWPGLTAEDIISVTIKDIA